QEGLQLTLHLALLPQPAARPRADAPRGPYVPHRQRGRPGGLVEPEQRFPAVALTALHQAERGGWRKVDDLELGHAVAEARLEAHAFSQRHGAFHAATPRE